MVQNADGSFTFTNEDGVTTDLDVSDLETLTSVTNVLTAGHLIGTYTDEDGNTTDLLETITTLVQNPDGSFTFTNEDGATTDLDVSDLETLTTVTNVLTAGHLIGTYTDEDGNTTDLLETVTELARSGSNLVFTDEDGNDTVIDIGDLETLSTVTNVLAVGNVIGTYTDEAGSTIDLRETVTTLADNGDGTFTFTHEDGSTSTISVAALETITEITNVIATGNLIGVYENEAGVLVDIRETITSLTATSASEITYTDELGNDVVIDIADLETISSITNVLANGHHIGTYTDENGTTIDLLETVTKVTANTDGTFTFTDEEGNDTDIDVSALETLTTITNTITGNLIATYTDEANGTFDINETITQLVANADGTLTYVDETGTKNVITIADGGAQPVQTIYEEFYAGGSDNGTAQAWGRNMTLTRTGTGQWTVTFASAHPDGTAYAANILTQEESNLRDSVLPSIVQGSKTANGFQFFLGTGDNGIAADVLVDTPFTVSVNAPVNVLVDGP